MIPRCRDLLSEEAESIQAETEKQEMNENRTEEPSTAEMGRETVLLSCFQVVSFSDCMIRQIMITAIKKVSRSETGME